MPRSGNCFRNAPQIRSFSCAVYRYYSAIFRIVRYTRQYPGIADHRMETQKIHPQAVLSGRASRSLKESLLLMIEIINYYLF
jgi:hypothetical protein